MPNLISVIVSTYERPDALDVVLRALSRQSDRRFEVVVADDGTGPPTAAVIERWRPRLGVPLTHVWRPHQGFRLAEMRNRGILAARGDYCVFLDGDCLTRADFVAKHRRLAEPGWLVTGNRVLLSEQSTATVLRGDIEPETWGFARWMQARLQGGVNRLAGVSDLPLGALRKVLARGWKGICGCNLAFWRDDLERVDGFDASYAGWGREDSDLLVRLLHAGVRRKDGRFATGVIHLWHPSADRAQLPDNDARLRAVVQSDRLRAESGLTALRSTASNVELSDARTHA
jgi:glycosyltransferase involved in cell wall biosynthesis